MTVDKAYIIRVALNQNSINKAQQAANSCSSVNMPWEYWDAYNGYSDPIIPPSHHHGIPSIVKITDHYLTRGEAACALSHISLWQHCAEIDQPIVILEHDAIMVQPYLQHSVYNSICYLGGHEQAKQGWQILPTPPHASEGPNYHFICRAHAYAIDPAVAKNLLAHVLKFGICAPLDILIRADIFPIHQMGIYAYNDWDGDMTNTSILGRPLHGRTTDRNDKLER